MSKTTKEKNLRHIELILHHDYLAITDGKKKKILFPIKVAKLISDMYLASGTTEKDLKTYAVGTGGYPPRSNPSYSLCVFNREIDVGNEFHWLRKNVEPYEEEQKRDKVVSLFDEGMSIVKNEIRQNKRTQQLVSSSKKR